LTLEEVSAKSNRHPRPCSAGGRLPPRAANTKNLQEEIVFPLYPPGKKLASTQAGEIERMDSAERVSWTKIADCRLQIERQHGSSCLSICNLQSAICNLQSLKWVPKGKRWPRSTTPCR